MKAALHVILLWFAGLGAATQFAKIAVPFPDVILLYPQNAEAIGWLLSIISLIGAILGAVSGSHYWPVWPSKLLIWGLVLGGCISLFQATGPGFAIMLASRFVEGLSHLAIVVAAPTLIAQITTGRARKCRHGAVEYILWRRLCFECVDRVAGYRPDWGLRLFCLLHGVLMLANSWRDRDPEIEAWI